MADAPPPLTATLEWDGEQQFTGQVGKHEVSIDGSAEAAPTPVQMLALSLAGCMSIDLVHILSRGRRDATSLSCRFVGERSSDNPKRFTRIRLEFTLTGAMEPEHVDRAIQLSREKYCSVWATFRPDIELDVTYTIQR
jgi:putative redox protein